MNQKQIRAAVEAMLFASGDPLVPTSWPRRCSCRSSAWKPRWKSGESWWKNGPERIKAIHFTKSIQKLTIFRRDIRNFVMVSDY